MVAIIVPTVTTKKQDASIQKKTMGFLSNLLGSKTLRNVCNSSLFLTTNLCAQNLVPNPSLEIYDTCPMFFGQIEYASGWFQPLQPFSSTDYFNPCTSYPDISVPDNMPGFEPAYEGIAYGGFAPFHQPGQDLREYIEVRLTAPLVVNTKYRLRFYVSPGDEMMYAISNIGAHFSTDSILTTSTNALPYIPQIEYSGFQTISDTAGWTLVEGIYISSGGEEYLTIGNFYPDANTTYSVIDSSGNPAAYYYIDSISLELYDDTGIPAIPSNSNIIVNNFLHHGDFFTTTNLPSQSILKVYDSRGRIVFRSEDYHNELCGQQLSSGLYLYEFILPDQTRKTGKLVVQ